MRASGLTNSYYALVVGLMPILALSCSDRLSAAVRDLFGWSKCPNDDKLHEKAFNFLTR